MSRLALYLLGPPRIELDGTPVQISRRKAAALLAYLAVMGRSYRRDTLATLLWPEQDQRSARASLRRALAALKEALGEGWLDAEREIIGFDRDADAWLDVSAFRERLAGCATHGHPPDEICPSCLTSLAEGVALYRDDFMAGFTLRDSAGYDDWQFFQTQGLRDEFAGALERLVCGHACCEDLDPAIAYARRWLALDPLHERAHRCLMDLYARAGQRAAALRQYAECERVLQEELDVPPDDVTVELYHAIRERRGPPGPAERLFAPAEPQPQVRVGNLPTQLVPFVGRAIALAEIGDRLDDLSCRLLTLVGPGGSGKTRLALETASAQVQRFPDGVDFVPLAPLDSPEAIVPAIAEALGFSFYEGGSQQQQLLDYLRNKRKLLVLDNYDHLPEGVGVVTEILGSAPGIQIVATSRAKLSVQGEHVYLVAGMDLPPAEGEVLRPAQDKALGQAQDMAQYDAVQLFVASARRAQPDFEATEVDLADIVRICHMVEGLPLAILLAAAWVTLLAPAEIATEIERSLDFLESDLRDIPERQRSMRAVFDYSWSLLAERERQVFQALSVFRGSFDRGAAERVAGASLRELMALAGKSLLHRSDALPMTVRQASLGQARDTHGGRRASSGLGIGRTGARYEVHGLLRQYAGGKLRASPEAATAVYDRHCAYYAAALFKWNAESRGPRQLAALAEVEADAGNVRAAWDWAIEQQYVERLDEAMDGLCGFYEWRGRHQEGETVCRAALSVLGPSNRGQERAALRDVRARSRFAPERPPDPESWAGSGDLAQAERNALRLRVLANALAWNSLFSRALGHTENARQSLQQALAHLASPSLAVCDVRQEKAFVLWQMGRTAYLSDREDASEFYERSLALYREMDDHWGTAAVLHDLGDLVEGSGAFDQAENLVGESLAIRQALGDRRGIAGSLRVLAVIAQLQGRLEESERLARRSLAAFQAIDDRVHTAEALINLGGTLLLLGDLAQAHAQLEESATICCDLGPSGGLTSLALTNLGLADLLLGDYAQANVWAEQGLAVAQETGYRNGIANALWLLGLSAVPRGDFARAQQLLLESVSIFEEIGHSEADGVRASLGYTAPALGQASLARQHLCRALQGASAIGTVIPFILAVPAAALLLADRGEVEQAIETYAFALRYPTVARARWFEDVAGRHIAAAAATLPPDAVAAARERGRVRTQEATIAALLEALGPQQGVL